MKPYGQLDGNVLRKTATPQTQTSLVSTPSADFARFGHACLRSIRVGRLGIGAAARGESGDCVAGEVGW